MDKFKNSEVKPFVFTDLQGTHVITQPRPESFEFKDLEGAILHQEKPASETIRTERKFEKNNSFKIDQVVRDHRGISEQEHDDFEARVAQEVNKRVEEIYQKAYEQGIQEGRQEDIGQERSEKTAKINEIVEEVHQMMEQLNSQLSQATINHKNEILRFVNQFSKWVLSKEIDQKEYLSSLLEKLLHELNTRRNMIIRVNEASYQLMPDIVSKLEERLGTLSNVRIEVSSEMNGPGIILESENGIVDASLENIFSKFDRFFEQVGQSE